MTALLIWQHVTRLALLNLRDNRSTVNRFIGNIQLDYKVHFLPDLHVLINAGMDRNSGSGNDKIDSMLATNYKTGGRKQYYEEVRKNQLLETSLFYATELKDIHTKIDVLAGHSYQDFKNNSNNFAAFSYRAIADATNPGKGDTIANSTPTFLTSPSQYRLEGYFGRANINIEDKYLITASIRRDASSKFSADNRVGYFPAVAAAWRLKQEFFQNTKIVSDLKLRLGYGVTGQQDGIDYYGYIPRYTRGNTSAEYQFGNEFYSYLRPVGYSKDLKWETTTTSNIGLDFGVLNNRISGSVDFYYKKTKDLLSTVPVAPGANFANQLLINVGNITAKGVEVTINTVPVSTKDFSWDLGFNFSYNKVEITNLLKQQDPSFKGIDVSGISGGTGNNIGKFLVGYAPYTFLVYKQIYDKNGNPIEGLYEDINRDGKVDDKDRYLYKKPAPDFLVGFSTQFRYKKLTLGITGHGMMGNYMYNNFNANTGVLRQIKNPLTFIGNAGVNYMETKFVNNQYLSDYYIENASFLRFDNINIGYNFGKALSSGTNLRVNASMQNVGIITKYKGLDPENSSSTGVDNNIYPRPRIYSLGFNLDF